MPKQDINRKLGIITGLDGDVTEVNSSIDMRLRENKEKKENG